MEVSTTEKQSMAKLDRNPEETESNRPPTCRLQRMKPKNKGQAHQGQETDTTQIKNHTAIGNVHHSENCRTIQQGGPTPLEQGQGDSATNPRWITYGLEGRTNQPSMEKNTGSVEKTERSVVHQNIAPRQMPATKPRAKLSA